MAAATRGAAQSWVVGVAWPHPGQAAATVAARTSVLVQLQAWLKRGRARAKKGASIASDTVGVFRVAVAQAQQAARHDQERSVMRMRW